MTGKMFDSSGRLNIPEPSRPHEEVAIKAPVVVNAVYCPEGHNLVDVNRIVSGFPAIVVSFEDKKGGQGLLAVSPVLGDTAYLSVEGEVNPDEPLIFSCPHCGVRLDVLSNCSCREDAVTVLAYLYPRRDPHQAIAFCNVLSCPDSAVIRSGEAIRLVKNRQ